MFSTPLVDVEYIADVVAVPSKGPVMVAPFINTAIPALPYWDDDLSRRVEAHLKDMFMLIRTNQHLIRPKSRADKVRWQVRRILFKCGVI